MVSQYSRPVLHVSFLVALLANHFCNIQTFVIKLSNSQNGESVELVDKILSSNSYNKDILPRIKSFPGSLEVKVSLLVRNIDSIDDDNMEMTIQATVWQEWTDERLKFNHSEVATLTNKDDQIWTPDLFFSNEKRSSFYNTMKPNTYFRISPDGKILYSKRISITLACPMNLKFFPLDIQECCILISSYSYTIDKLRSVWNQPTSVLIVSQKFLLLKKFKLHKFSVCNCSEIDLMTSVPSGTYACLSVKLEFHRRFGYYFNTVYFPSALLVIISWVSFWIGTNAFEARLSLGVTTLLTLGTQTYGSNQKDVPAVSYTKALDIWIGGCIVFIVCTIFEVSTLMFLRQRRKQDGKEKVDPEDPFQSRTKDEQDKPVEKLQVAVLSKMDLVSRIAFPLSFIVFNIIYWSVILLTDQNPNVSRELENL